MKLKFSIATSCFYDPRIHEDIPEDAIEVSEEEFAKLSVGRNSGRRIIFSNGKLSLAALSEEQLAAKERAWRDTALTGAQWLRDRHRDQVEIGAPSSLMQEQFHELLVYLQALRDWPQSEHFPEIEYRPVAPPWIAEQTR